MFEIRIDNGPTTGECTCMDKECPFHEEASSHAEVLAMQNDAAMHALSTGHPVAEHWEGRKVVSALTGVEF
jgi:hypothetical protein